MNPKTIVVLPAYNAAKTLERTVADLPREWTDEIILVDDFSRDETAALAEKLGLTVHRHPQNQGYGANQKTCYRLALEHGADIVVMIHPDYQYDPKLVKYLAGFIADGYCDVMLGTRIRSRREALEGGMPLWKYLSNRALTVLENILSGYNLTEWHTGMRAYSRQVLRELTLEKFSDDFIFDSQVLFQVIEKKYRIGEIPVPVRYFPEASSIDFWASAKYGLGTLAVAGKHFGRRIRNNFKF